MDARPKPAAHALNAELLLARAPHSTVDSAKMDELENELKNMIVEVLLLEDMKPEQIDSEQPLFAKGLGLTSIDALELAMALSQRFGVKLDPDDEKNKAAFESVRALAQYIMAQKKSA